MPGCRQAWNPACDSEEQDQSTQAVTQCHSPHLACDCSHQVLHLFESPRKGEKQGTVGPRDRLDCRANPTLDEGGGKCTAFATRGKGQAAEEARAQIGEIGVMENTGLECTREVGQQAYCRHVCGRPKSMSKSGRMRYYALFVRRRMGRYRRHPHEGEDSDSVLYGERRVGSYSSGTKKKGIAKRGKHKWKAEECMLQTMRDVSLFPMDLADRFQAAMATLEVDDRWSSALMQVEMQAPGRGNAQTCFPHQVPRLGAASRDPQGFMYREGMLHVHRARQEKLPANSKTDNDVHPTSGNG
nr:hypothetical protein CFP56_00329 [Quercus suber]